MSRLFFDDRLVWIISILLAVMLWVQVTGGRAHDMQRTISGVPVQWRDLPEDLSVVDMQPSLVDITVRGVRDVMQDLGRDDFIATVSLAAGDPGSLDYFLTVSVPRGVQLIQASPQTVTVTLEESIEEVFPVVVRLRGEAQLDLAEPSTDPPQVIVKGAVSLVESINEVVAEISVEGASRPIDERALGVPLDDRGREVRGVIVTPRQVDVRVPLQADQVSRDVPVRLMLLAGREVDIAIREYTVVPEVVTVTGDEEALGDLEFIYTEPVDILEIRDEYLDEVDALEEGEFLTVTTEILLVNPQTGRTLETSIDPRRVTVEMLVEKLN